MSSSEKLTPLLKQYYAIKNQHPGRILFFRMGDFYELFGDDAVTASSILGIALTSRSHGDSGKVPLAGFPHHTLNRYLTKILKAGHNVAVCDQVEDPKLAKGIVKREVVEVLTPGSITIDGALEDDRPNYLASINIIDDLLGLSLLDITTGKFLIDEMPLDQLSDHINFYEPSEIIVPDSFRMELQKLIENNSIKSTLTTIDDYRFESSIAFNELTTHFKVSDLDGFGLGKINPVIGAAGAALGYIKDLKMGHVSQVTSIERIYRDNTMNLDRATIRNLELIETPYEGRKNSLLDTIDNTLSSGGGRLLRSWVLSPLKILKLIQARQRAVVEIKSNLSVQNELRTILKGLPDIERLAAKVGALKAGPRDIVYLKVGLQKGMELKKSVSKLKSPFIKDNLKQMPKLDDSIWLIEKAIVEEPPANLTDGGMFNKGYSDKLDVLIAEIDEAKDYIYTLQQSEREKTGITSLKVGYTRVFGYYLEVTRTHLSKVPAHYVRKQTLVSAERFITEELKTKEELILNAEEKIRDIEQQLFDEIIAKLNENLPDFQKVAEIASVFDVLSSFVVILNEPGYCMPELNDKMAINVEDGRHPVMEKLMPSGKFVPNDINIDGKIRRMAIITGPNMAGKSTYLRQIGLIILMAHMGAPVPAKSAGIGICDRIFTRVGASDDLLRGRSTFMVEMTEAASILNNATDKSLILLDELGRGTSTYDGLAVAWSLVEYLNTIVGKRARTLFATHYHELIELADKSDGIINLQVAVKQWQDSIVFLYKIMDGGCDDSYGVQVARLAGLPQRMLDRAREILTQLESNHSGLKGPVSDEKPGSTYQISLFSAEENRLFNLLKSVNLDSVTPIEALNLLNKMKKVVDDEV